MTTHVQTEKEDSAVYRSFKCYRCGGRFEACTFDDTLTMLIDERHHQVPVKHVPCMRCFDCQTTVTNGCSDEAIQYYYLQYVKSRGLYTPVKRLHRWWRNYKMSWYYWHWNRAPWAQWTWGDEPVPDRVLKRRWWQWR
jgi:hypothetical protein